MKYFDMLKNLLPTGKAWNRFATNRNKLLEVRANGYGEVDSRTNELVEEAIPSTTRELLPDWERVCSLPDPLLAEEEQTEAERRNAVLAKLIAGGNLSKDFLIQIAAHYGYEIEIEEFFGSSESGSLCGSALCGSAICGGNTDWH